MSHIMLLWFVKIYERNLKKLQFTMMSPPKVQHKRKHVTELRSPLIKTIDRSVETLGRGLKLL